MPDGWLKANSNPKPGEIHAAGENEEVVIWRSASGKLCAMDSRCPHQWSHLAYEGAVSGEELICQSHFWCFTQSGQGYKQTLSGRQDPKSDIPTYETQETEGEIWIKLPPP